MPRELFVAYFRVGTGRQGRSELGLDAQHRAVADYLDAGARELVGEYTEVESGQRCDRPELETLPIVRELQESGIGTLQGMADALNARGIPTARGARWYPTTVKNLLGRDVQGSQQVAA